MSEPTDEELKAESEKIFQRVREYYENEKRENLRWEGCRKAISEGRIVPKPGQKIGDLLKIYDDLERRPLR